MSRASVAVDVGPLSFADVVAVARGGVPVVRTDTLRRHPEVRRALDGLGGRITVAHMREMNHRVEALRQAPSAVARDFLAGQLRPETR